MTSSLIRLILEEQDLFLFCQNIYIYIYKYIYIYNGFIVTEENRIILKYEQIVEKTLF